MAVKYSKRSRFKSRAKMQHKNRIFAQRSNMHFTLKVISPEGRIIAECSTKQKDISKGVAYTGNKDAAFAVGVAMGEKVKKLKLEDLAFDRGGLKFVGRVKAAADGLRSVKVMV